MCPLRAAARAAARTARAAAAADELSRQRTGLNRFMNTLGLRYCVQRAEKRVAIAIILFPPKKSKTIRIILAIHSVVWFVSRIFRKIAVARPPYLFYSPFY